MNVHGPGPNQFGALGKILGAPHPTPHMACDSIESYSLIVKIIIKKTYSTNKN